MGRDPLALALIPKNLRENRANTVSKDSRQNRLGLPKGWPHFL